MARWTAKDVLIEALGRQFPVLVSAAGVGGLAAASVDFVLNRGFRFDFPAHVIPLAALILTFGLPLWLLFHLWRNRPRWLLIPFAGLLAAMPMLVLALRGAAEPTASLVFAIGGAAGGLCYWAFTEGTVLRRRLELILAITVAIALAPLAMLLLR